jgi:hypothetical protein
MDVYTHTFIAVGLIAVSYYVGDFIGRRHGFEFIVSRMLQKLEDDGFIKIKIDGDGDKEIIPISEIERDAKT